MLAGARLSPQQRWWWARPTVRVRGRVRIDGPLDGERLAVALARVIARHEVLRTVFRSDPRLRYPLQVVVPEAAPAWQSVDLRGQPQPDPDDTLWRDAGQRFDLARGPVLDVRLVRLADDRHELIMAMPALVADRASIGLLVGELAGAYAGGALAPADDPIPYAQYAEWQNEQVAEAPPASAGPPVVLPFEGAATGNLGASGDASATASGRSGHVGASGDASAAATGRSGNLGASSDASAAASGFAAACIEVAIAAANEVANERLTPAILLAAWQVQLARLADREDVTIALSTAGRAHEDLDGVMGPIAAWAPFACRVEAAAPFAELAARAGRALEGAAALEGALADDTAAHAGFELDELPAAFSAGGLRWTLTERCSGGGGLKLALAVQRSGARWNIALWHDPLRIGHDGAAAIAEQYAVVLARAAGAASAPAGSLRLLGAPERARRLAEGGASGRATVPAPTLHRAFEAHVAAQPDALALVCGDEQLCRRELNERANRLAHHLRRRGVAGGSPVGLFCERSAGAIVGLLGILKAGGAYVPLDPGAPAQRLADQLRQASLVAVVVQDATRARLPMDDLPVVSLDAAALLEDSASDPAPVLHPDALASVIFTSGSTGAPKGAAITHRGIAEYTAAVCAALDLVPGLAFATVSTLTADLGNTSIFAALATGGCLHVIDHAIATDGRRFADYARRWQLDVLKIVPSHLAALLEAGGAAVLPRRLVVLGGEALPLALVDRIAALDPRCEVANHYGPTETTVGALALPQVARADRRGCASVPIGRPLGCAEAYVLDAELEPVPTAAIGELYLGGAGLARGYLGRPDLTAERFVPHPFVAGARLYRTGDRARYRPDGTIEFVGRADHQIKIRGYRVELGEIEARLREHPAIAQAAVVCDDGAVATGPSLIAYVVPATGALDEPALRAFLRARVPDYMMPARVVALRALPLTANGKLDRRALPSPALARRARIAPRTPAEATIAAIWADLLGRDEPSVDDNFFELGGHSLLAIRLMYRIQQSLGCSLSLPAIFDAPTIAGLAQLALASGTSGEVPAPPRIVVPLHATGARAPLFCVDPTGRHVAVYQPLADALAGDPPVVGLDLAPVLGEPASIAAIAARLAEAIRTHQPDGPYHLLGWSLGGVLALGAARALEQDGARVAFLGIVDTQPRSELYAGGAPDVIDELAGYVDVDRRAELLALPAAELAALRSRLAAATQDERAIAAASWAQDHGFLPREAAISVLAARYALLRAAANFLNDLPRPCVQAPLHVWWSTETLTRAGSVPMSWQPYTSGAVSTATATGDHLEAVRGRDLQEALRAIAGRSW